jgi:ATP-dependent RNA helicase DDX20
MQRAQASEDVALGAASSGVDGLDAATSFEQLCLPAALLRGLQRAGYRAPSPVQRAAIPLGRAGADLIVQAKSGTGKTCMFAAVLLPSLNLVDPSPQALVVAPTREIAVQIRDVLSALGHFYTGLVVQAFIGGVPVASDRAALRHTCHIAVGTPGRLLTLLREHYLPAQCLRRVVLDEVDQLLGAEREGNRGAMAAMVLELLDMRSSVEPLANANTSAAGGPAFSTAPATSSLVESSSPPVPLHSQTIACSATLSDALHSELMRRMRPNTKSVLLCPDTPSLKGVRQFYVDISASTTSGTDSVLLPAGQQEAHAAFKTDAAIAAERYAAFAAKVEFLLGALARIPFQQCVVFSNNRTRAAELVELLQSAGWPARCVAGDMSQVCAQVHSRLHLTEHKISCIV